MGRGQEEMFRKVASYFVVFFHNFSAARLDASAAAVLIAEIRQSLTLDIALVADGDDNIFLGNKIFRINFTSIGHNGGAAGITEAFLHIKKIILGNPHDLMLIGKDTFEIGNGRHDFRVFIFDFLAFQTCEALETHIQDSLGLFLAEAKL